jgi:hypothetical protein
MLNNHKEVASLQRMTVNELRERYREVFGEESRSRNKQFLWKRVAWRMQALEQGGLSERARKRAMELAKDAEIRIRPPRDAFRNQGSPESPTDRDPLIFALPRPQDPASWDGPREGVPRGDDQGDGPGEGLRMGWPGVSLSHSHSECGHRVEVISGGV